VKIIIGSFLILLGASAFFLAFVFFISSQGEGKRLIVAAVSSILSSVSIFFGIQFIRSWNASNPKKIRERILQLARKNHGKISDEALTGEIGDSDAVRSVLQFFLTYKIAFRKNEGPITVYEFPDFHLELVVKQCPYCSNDYPIRDDVEVCPSCGGDLKTITQRVQSDDDAFNLDD